MALAALPETNDWTLGEKLGEGGFGQVFRVKDRRGTSLPYAAKRVSVASREEMKTCAKEIETLAKLQHPYIIRYIGFKLHPTDGRFALIITELARDGSIDDKLTKDGPFSERLTWQYTKMVLEGLAYIHSQKVIHRDIKGANILLDGGVVKLADFGVSKIAELLGTILTMNAYYAAGTLYFMSPELLLTFAGVHQYGFSTDIWSYGCTVIHMLTGTYPNAGQSAGQLVERAKRGQPPVYMLPPGTSAAMQRFLQRCFVGDSSMRPSARQLLAETFSQ